MCYSMSERGGGEKEKGERGRKREGEKGGKKKTLATRIKTETRSLFVFGLIEHNFVPGGGGGKIITKREKEREKEKEKKGKEPIKEGEEKKEKERKERKKRKKEKKPVGEEGLVKASNNLTKEEREGICWQIPLTSGKEG